ncbi:MAG: FAD-dependent oxidoreductase [Micromonosporaceae bacterium]|nr:FAD-dependent oxidoreductase [Micromonosporaceae bacterium]
MSQPTPQLTVYGAPWCPDCKRAKKFLAEHRVAYRWIDIDQDPDGLAYVERQQNGGRTIPMVMFPDGSRLLEPGNDELAAKLGLSLAAERTSYDLVIVGGGPAGLAAAIYAAREGIDALVVDKAGLGGQAGITEKIENYPGFPEGIAGGELADRFVAQARRYGVELLSAVEATGVERDADGVTVSLGSGQQVMAPAVLIATGSAYRRLGIPGEEELIGAGVHFCATCDGPFYRGAGELLVIGGGNSALEEGLFLAQFADRIRVVAHGPELKASRVLQDKVRGHPQFTIHLNTDVRSLAGAGGRLTEVVATDRDSGAEYRWRPEAAFVFIGQTPNTGWLGGPHPDSGVPSGGTLRLDRWGFVVTDDAFATSMPGVFAAGDVRAGTTKQLGAAVGEGIAALIAIRGYLQRHSDLRTLEVNA